MPYYLMRLGTGLRSTHIMIVNLIRLIIETGMLTGMTLPSSLIANRLIIFTAAVAILHFCLYFIKTTTFLIPGLTISKVYANTTLVILNNRMKILNGRFPNDSDDNFDVSPHTIAPRSPASRRTMDRSVFTLPSERKAVRTGGSIVVTKDRLVFRLDPASDTRRSGLQSVSEGETQSVRESVHSERHVYVSAGFSSYIRKKVDSTLEIQGHAYGSDMDIPLSSVSHSHGNDLKAS